MSIIVSIETATRAGSVAVHDGGKLVGLQQYDIEKSHSSLLHTMVQQVLENSNLTASAIDAIAISAGPGSYTGLRIGVSTAKGLCYALDKPLIAVNTLKAMAQQVANTATSPALLCPMIDARRLEVYCMLLDNEMSEQQATEAMIIDEGSFAAELEQQHVIFFGDGAEKCKSIIQHPNAFFVDGVIPSAREIGQLAHTSYTKGEFENLAYYEPFYLKEFRIIKSKKKHF